MKKKHMSILIAAITIISIASCTQQTQPSSENGEAQIRQVWDDFTACWVSGDATECAAFYTVDAVNIPPNYKVNQGREEIEAFYSSLFASSSSRAYEHNIKSITVSGDFAVELGEFRADWISTTGEAWEFVARSLTHWEKADDGRWMIRAFVFNQPPNN